MQLQQVSDRSRRVIDAVRQVIVGKDAVLSQVLMGVLADGHILIQDNPGLAKTLIAHSFAEVRWQPKTDSPPEPPNPYSNHLDVMSDLTLTPTFGWHEDLPATLAVNRYAAGWIDSGEVALHLTDEAVYTLRPPRQGAYQMLVVSSGRPGAFTTLEVLDERNPAYVDATPQVFDPSAPGGLRPYRYHGVYVNRYDQTTGAGPAARSGPALWSTANPDYATDVGWGRDDYAVIPGGEARDIGGGVRVEVAANPDGSYDVTVSGGRVAPFAAWCRPLWFTPDTEYDLGCAFAD